MTLSRLWCHTLATLNQWCRYKPKPVMTCEVNNIFVVMTLTLYSKFFKSNVWCTYTDVHNTYPCWDKDHDSGARRGGGRPYPSLPDECRYNVTYDRFIFHRNWHAEWPWPSYRSNYIVKLCLCLLSRSTCRRSISNVLVTVTHDLDPVVTLTLNQKWVITLTHALTTTTTGHDPGHQVH